MMESLTEAKLPARISNTAGTYLCNNVLYHILHYSHKNRLGLSAGFIHIPASHELATEKNIPSWSEVDL